MKNILLVRTDRIGDVVLSLPCAAFLKRALPGAGVTFLAREYTAPLVRLSPDVDRVISDDQVVPARTLAATLRSGRFDAAVLLHPTARLAWALRLAGIPVRAGTAYRWYSFLLNRRVRQHRKFSLRHELEHNLDLVARGFDLEYPSENGQRVAFPPRIGIPAELAAATLATCQLPSHRPFVVIHPGSGGSAMDWPLERFAELADRIQAPAGGLPGTVVVITLGPGEEPLRGRLEPHLKTKPVWISGLTLPELAAVLSRAALVVANSTGPLHIAAAGTRVIGLYCPVVPCHPRRWGPYGPGHAVIMPDEDRVCRSCAGPGCAQYDCMAAITVERVYQKVREMTATP